MNEAVVIRGAGDLASGVAYRLHRSGFKILMLDIEKPLVIRRTVSYAQAIFDGEAVIQEIHAVKTENKEEILSAWENDDIAVMIDPKAEIISDIKPRIVVDAIIAKKNIGTTRDMADIVVAIGPGFEAGKDADAVVESKRGHYLGTVILKGSAIENTGIPGNIGGYAKERVIHSPAAGIIKHVSKIGDRVKAGETVATIGKVEVKSEINGVLRGLIQENIEVYKGLKIADVDPRGEVEHCFTISDKALSIAGGVLEAIMYNTYKKSAKLKA